MKLVLLALGALAVGASTGARATAQGPDGKAIFEANCKKCHGPLGVPTKDAKDLYPKVATFADPKFLASHTVDSIVKVLTHGKGEDMKSLKLKLTPAEMVAVATYVRTLAPKAHP